MSMRNVFKCDVCRDEIPQRECYGCKFSTLKFFKLSDPSETDGTHICFGCLKQLEAQIPQTKASHSYVQTTCDVTRE